MNTVTSAIERIGLTRIGNTVKRRPSAVQKWRDRGRLPKTDLGGLTNYAEAIAKLSQDTDEPVTAEQLLKDTRAAWLVKV